MEDNEFKDTLYKPLRDTPAAKVVARLMNAQMKTTSNKGVYVLICNGVPKYCGYSKRGIDKQILQHYTGKLSGKITDIKIFEHEVKGLLEFEAEVKDLFGLTKKK